MFERILVPLDGSELAEAILPAAEGFARALGATLVLFHGTEPGDGGEVHGERHLTEHEEAERYLQEIGQRLARAGLKAETHVHESVEPKVAEVIARHIAELHADLVMLVAHGGKRLRDFTVGNMTQQVVSQATTPVFFQRASLKDGFMCQKILLPLDCTEAHEPSLPATEAVAAAFGAEVHLLHVVPTPETLNPSQAASGVFLPSSTDVMLRLAVDNAAQYLEDRMTEVRGLGISATAEVLRGDPAEAILGCADADLIVLATHGRSASEGFWAGSVTRKILDRSERPVLLVPVSGEEPLR